MGSRGARKRTKTNTTNATSSSVPAAASSVPAAASSVPAVIAARDLVRKKSPSGSPSGCPSGCPVRYLFGDRPVEFYHGDRRVREVNACFLGDDVDFRVDLLDSREDAPLRARDPASRHATARQRLEMDLLWHVNALQNAWMTKCPREVAAEVARTCLARRTSPGRRRPDEELLRGFSFTGAFGGERRTRFTGEDVRALCRTLAESPREEVVRAADIMNCPLDGHLANADTAIPDRAYRADPEAHDVLVESGVLVKSVVEGTGEVFLRTPAMRDAEVDLLRSLTETRRRFGAFDREVSAVPAGSAVSAVSPEAETAETLCDEQRVAVDVSMRNAVSYITGSAGRGKSSSIMEIVRRSRSGTIICTPTHAARKVIQRRVARNGLLDRCRVEVIAFVTIHAPKYSDGRRRAGRGASDREDRFFRGSAVETLVVEEAGMVGTATASTLLSALLGAFPSIVRLVFVGDSKQLQSIAKGNLLNDLVRARTVPGSVLAINHRSGSLSTNIDRILEGDGAGIVLEPGRFEVVRADGSEVVDVVVREMNRISRETRHSVHSLCYTHRDVDRVNGIFQLEHGTLLMLTPGLKVRVKDPARIKCPADGVQVHANDMLEIVASGTQGATSNLRLREWPRTSGASVGDAFPASVRTKSLHKALELGFSTTCHSFQGDEVDAVVVHAVQSCRFFDRLALYTAVSRARELIVLVTVDDDDRDGGWRSIVATLNPERVSCLSHVLDGLLLDQEN